MSSAGKESERREGDCKWRINRALTQDTNVSRPAVLKTASQTRPQRREHLYFLTTSMCFRPKKRASIDQAPGPIIAKLAPKPERMIAVHGSADPEKTSHSCVAATRSPIYGVPNPITRRTDAINGSATSVEMRARPGSQECLTQENGANEESLDKETDAGPPGREGRE